MKEKTITKPKKIYKKNAGITGAEALILSLIEENVETIFGYPGGAIMPIYDALYDYRDKINHILVRHEQGAVHAAQGYARVSGKPGVCFATSGPGATNLITGIADAQIDSTPLVCITGQVSSHLLGTDAFQETDVVGISMPVTKWNCQVTKAEEIPEAVAKAFFIAKTGRPGPVLIDITKDAQFGNLEFRYEKCGKIRSYIPFPKFNPESVESASKLINNAKQPLILAGQGVLLSGAKEELKTFSEKTGIPVACTLLGLSSFPVNHPLYAGMLGMHGNYSPNILTNQSDVIIAIGMRFDDRVTGNLGKYARQAKIIHIEIDPAEINKNVKVDVAINSDAKEALKALIPLAKKNSHAEWLQKFDEGNKLEFEKVGRNELHPGSGKLKMAEAIRIISEKTNGNAVIVSDVGQHQMVTSRYFNYKDESFNVTSGGLGTMGFALPAALGAKTAAPNKQVIAIIGDGGFQMTLQELGTIAQTKAAVKIVILNNNFLGMVRQWQEMFFEKRYSFTEMTNPDFVAVAKGFGINAKKVTERSLLENSITEMLKHKEAFLLEVVVEKEGNVFPMIPTGASVSEIRLE